MNNIKNTFRAGFVMAAGLIAMYSCTDTWDDHYDSSLSSLKFDGTTMQALESKAPDFAKVVKAYGFNRELASDNTYTVWAPADGSFNLSDYVDENGKPIADSTEVVNEFIKNHVALYSLSVTPNDQSFSLLNQKRGTMTSDHKFGHVDIDAQNYNISCTNGVLHMINTPSPFSFNLFELIAKQYKDDPDEGKDTLSLYAYLYDPKVNKDTLIESKSVSRGVDEDGNKIWVSKYFERNNTVLKNFDARIYEEDSNFIAILPSAKAYAERYNYAKSLLKFNPSEDNRAAGTVDSLVRHYANSFAMTDLYYNKNANEHWEDSLKSTNYYTLWHGVDNWTEHVYYSKEPKVMPEDKEINDILAKCGEPIECSNGTAYLVDEYPFTAQEQFFKKIKVTANDNNVNKLGDGDSWDYTKGVQKSFGRRGVTIPSKVSYIDDEGEIRDTTYRQTAGYIDVAPTSGNITVGFNVEKTLSGTYDIYLVTCPIWLKQEYQNLTEDELDKRPYRFSATIFERDNEGKTMGQFPKKGTQLLNPNEEDPKQNKYFYSKGYAVDDNGIKLINDTIYLGSYSFKNAYYGRSEYGVILQLTSVVLSSQRKTYSAEMLINNIILKPREESAPDQEQAKMRKGIQLSTSNKRY